jgi:hypothetical protein
MTPDSSRTSRRTASSTDSPASTNPIGTEVKTIIPQTSLQLRTVSPYQPNKNTVVLAKLFAFPVIFCPQWDV